MYVYIYVYNYVYTYVCIHTHIYLTAVFENDIIMSYMFIYMYMYVYIYVYNYVYTYVCIYTHIYLAAVFENKHIFNTLYIYHVYTYSIHDRYIVLHTFNACISLRSCAPHLYMYTHIQYTIYLSCTHIFIT